MIKDNLFSYFINDSSFPRFNYLLKEFPDFDIEGFNQFLIESNENAKVVNYLFHEIYPILFEKKNLIHEVNLNKLIKLLNNISQDAQIELWKEKQDKLYNWYKNSDVIKSYFREINQQRISGMIIYLIYEVNNLPMDEIEKKRNRKLATGLIIYLTDDSFIQLGKHEYFKEIFDSFHDNFSNKEIEILIKIKPNILQLMQFSNSDSESELRYKVTLELSHQADIDSIINSMVLEYRDACKLIANGLNLENSNFIKNADGIFAKMEYLIELVRIFPEDKQGIFFFTVCNEELTKGMIRQFEKMTIDSLIQDKFKILEEIRSMKKTSL